MTKLARRIYNGKAGGLIRITGAVAAEIVRRIQADGGVDLHVVHANHQKVTLAVDVPSPLMIPDADLTGIDESA